MTKPTPIPETKSRWSKLLTRQLMRFGPNKMVLIVTGITALLSVLITSTALAIFQGYIDLLGICICIAAPVLILPLPARLFFTTLLRLKETEQELSAQNRQLENALREIKTLSGFLPICSSCKNIRDDEGYWKEIEQYISDHSDLQLTHGICPDCLDRLYPELKTQSCIR